MGSPGWWAGGGGACPPAPADAGAFAWRATGTPDPAVQRGSAGAGSRAVRMRRGRSPVMRCPRTRGGRSVRQAAGPRPDLCGHGTSGLRGCPRRPRARSAGQAAPAILSPSSPGSGRTRPPSAKNRAGLCLTTTRMRDPGTPVTLLPATGMSLAGCVFSPVIDAWRRAVCAADSAFRRVGRDGVPRGDHVVDRHRRLRSPVPTPVSAAARRIPPPDRLRVTRRRPGPPRGGGPWGSPAGCR